MKKLSKILSLLLITSLIAGCAAKEPQISSEDTSINIEETQSAMSIYELMDKLNEMGEDVLFVGDGIKAYEEKIQEGMKVPYVFAPITIREQKASSVVECAYKLIKEDKFVESSKLELEYLRKSQAERELEAKNNLNIE